MGTTKEQRLPRYLAIDIDPEGLLVVSGTAGSSGSRVEQAFAWIPGQEHGPPPLNADTAKPLGEELRDRLKAAGIPLGPVLVGIGRDKVILKDLKHPPVDARAEPALIRFQALKEITEAPDEIVLDYVPLTEASADPAADRKAMAVVVKKDYFAAVQSMVAAAGLKLSAVTPRPFAVAAGLSRALASGAAHKLGTPDATAAVVTLSSQGGEFTIVRGGKVAFARAIPSQVLINDALLLGEVKRNLTTFNGQNQGQAVTALYVPEAENILGGWSSKLRNGLSIPVHSYDPVGAVPQLKPELHGRFAGAAGLLAGRGFGLPINFASPRQPAAKTDPRKAFFLAAAAAAVVVLLGGGIAGYLALASADDNLQAKLAEKADLEKLLADWDPDRKRLEASDQWESRGVNYLDELFDLSDRMPAGDTLRVSSFKGEAVKPDKNGKQNGQALFTLKVGAKNANASTELMSAMVRDNTNHKYYTETRKIIGGIDNHSNVYNQQATIDTRVFRRLPDEYVRYPYFQSPRRSVILGGTGEPAPKEPEKKAEAEPEEEGM